MTLRIASVLTIAGSDSGGGAGIQADLKTFAAFGVHGASAITAITAQNTRRVVQVYPLPPLQLAAQLDAVLEDIRVDAVKIGMLGNAAAVRVVIDCLRQRRFAHVVLDPVLIATSGTVLLDTHGVALLRDKLLPLVSVLTPNLPEAEALLGHRIDSAVGLAAAARALRELGCGSVLLKGAHLAGPEIHDWLVTAERSTSFAHARMALEGHGTGCTLAAALAACLARGADLETATRQAIDFVQAGLARAFYPGTGAAVLGNFRRD